MRAGASPALVQPIAGVLAASTDLLAAAAAALARAVGPIASASEPVPWMCSDYYASEMGADLWRQYVALDARISAHTLADLKRLTNSLEDRWRVAAKRSVNLDAGYLDLSRVVLASTKDAAHRVAIAPGLFAEATLHFAHGEFRPWPYTYPDYAGADARAFFTGVRARFRAERALTGDAAGGTLTGE
jgi:Domain of unknown function (DUF4416)